MICDQNSLPVPRNRARESGRCSTGSDRTDKREITRKRRLRPSTSPHFEVSHSTQEAGQTGNASSRSDYFVSSPDSVAGSAASFDWGSAFTQSAVDAFRACPNFEREGVRHLCRQLCYLRAYEMWKIPKSHSWGATSGVILRRRDRPNVRFGTAIDLEPGRKWHALRCAVARAGSSTRVLRNWTVRMDGGQGHEYPWRISYISPDGDVFPSAKRVLASLGLVGTATDNRASPTARQLRRVRNARRRQSLEVATTCTVSAPRGEGGRPMYGPNYLLKETSPNEEGLPPSPFGLIEELLTDDPWKVLLGCIMLNQTTRWQMDPVLVRFLEKFPNATATASASLADVIHLAGPLGLQEKRPIAIIRFSQEYLRMEWKDPEDLPWIGKYAADAYKIFVERNWRDVRPNDHALNWWVEWMRGTSPEDVH